MSDELMRCPFCGGAASHESKYDGNQGWLVYCVECHAKIWRGCDSTLCVKLWNRRTPGVATLGTPVGEIEGRPVLVGGVQDRARPPDVARLLAAVLDDLVSLDEAGWLDRGQRDRMEKLRVVIAAAHEAAQSGRPAGADVQDGT